MSIIGSASIVGTLGYLGASSALLQVMPTTHRNPTAGVIVYIEGDFVGVITQYISLNNGVDWTATGNTYSAPIIETSYCTVGALYKLVVTTYTSGKIEYSVTNPNIVQYMRANNIDPVCRAALGFTVHRPFIVGFAGAAGNVLTVRTQGLVTPTYQWQKDGVDIGGETAIAYTVLAGDVGHYISCNVNAMFTTTRFYI